MKRIAAMICLVLALLLTGCAGSAPVDASAPPIETDAAPTPEPTAFGPEREAEVYLPILEAKQAELESASETVRGYPVSAAGYLSDLDGDGARELLLFWLEETDGAVTVQMNVCLPDGRQTDPIAIKALRTTPEEQERRGSEIDVDLSTKDGETYVHTWERFTGQDYIDELGGPEDTPEGVGAIITYETGIYYQLVDGSLEKARELHERSLYLRSYIGGEDPGTYEPTAAYLVDGAAVGEVDYDAALNAYDWGATVFAYRDDQGQYDSVGQSTPLPELIDRLREAAGLEPLTPATPTPDAQAVSYTQEQLRQIMNNHFTSLHGRSEYDFPFNTEEGETTQEASVYASSQYGGGYRYTMCDYTLHLDTGFGELRDAQGDVVEFVLADYL